MIQSREEADRLARAICADINLYHDTALQNDPTNKAVKEALREGMQLYLSRAPRFPEMFSRAVEGLILSRLTPPHRDTLRAVLDNSIQEAPATPAEEPEPREKPTRRRDNGDGANIALLGLALLTVTIAVALFIRSVTAP
jgi:hypothetical protein